MSRKIFVIVMVFLFTFTGIGGVYASQDVDGGQKAINEIFNYLHKYHKDSPSVDQLVEGAIWGMIDTLNDPYTVYMDKDEVDQFVDSIDGNYKGVGIYLESQPDYPRVVEVFSGSPAKAAGVMPGDAVTRVNGKDIKGMALTDVVQSITGPEGTEVELTVNRDGKEIVFRLKRAALSVATVNSRVIGKNTGYIAVKTFGTKTVSEFKDALDGLNGKNITGLVVDLRDNPGGYLESAAEMAELFLKPGDLIVKTIYNDGTGDEYVADGKNAGEVKVPVVILVNSNSASAAEIFSGALQDHGTAKLVGETTFGKGVVQKVIPLEEGGALKVTVAEYTTPSGRHLNKKGIRPDYFVSTEEAQLPFALALLQPGSKRELKFTSGSNEVDIDGEKIKIRNAPITRENTVYLPLRFTFEALGYVVSWDETAKSIAVQKGDSRINIPAGGDPLLNGTKIEFPGRIYFANGISYVSADMMRALGFSCNIAGEGVVVESGQPLQ